MTAPPPYVGPFRYHPMSGTVIDADGHKVLALYDAGAIDAHAFGAWLVERMNAKEAT